ncbi:hypothetical protein B296_00004274 [Ensete ventricosum]|uniref:Uncharacterized protein n=1 Tax=Ensete ventricosum TaxID=4639 RepID=A0A426ZAH8_ENSVE|nr:hypothetical protein B296_00004274 [Ensete ventricosum]
MLPPRFLNSGIRAKVVHAKIGFKLCVMRFNRVELFYMFVPMIGSDSSAGCGLRVVIVVLLAGAVCYDQVHAKASGYYQGSLQGAVKLRQVQVATRSQPARGDRLSKRNTHRKAAYGQRHHPQGQSLVGVTARRDDACRGSARGGATYGNDACPQGRLPKGNGSHPQERGVATTGKGNRHLRNGGDDSGGSVVRARAVGLGFLFNKGFF